MARKTNDLDKSSKNEIDSKKINTKLETKTKKPKCCRYSTEPSKNI